jgi:cholesterol transport system auxiliary component
MIRPGLVRLALAGAVTLALAALGGCITLFPKEKPVQLYRFDAQVQPAGGGRAFAVRTGGAYFDPAAAGDRIMTVDGDQIGYLEPGRWSSPASQLFDEAVAHGFNAASQVRLVGPGQQAKAQYRLVLAVTKFEAHYVSGPTAAPTVMVTVRATLDRTSDQSQVDSKEFNAEVPAGDNRFGPIVQAYDQATSKVVSDLVAWVSQTAAG